MAQTGPKGKKKDKNNDIKLQVIIDHTHKYKLTTYFLLYCQLKPSEEVDLLGEDAMNNAYNICHNIQVTIINIT